MNTAADPGEPSLKEEEGEEEEGESDPGPPGVDNPSDELGQEATKENKSDVASDAKDDDGEYRELAVISHLLPC